MTIVITGGAGFIGSHLIDYLIAQKEHVICIDDLSLGNKENVKHHFSNPLFAFVCSDILNKEKIEGIFKQNNVSCVFHFAANSDIQKGMADMSVDVQKTFMTTLVLLECMKNNNVKKIIFPSSSAIYGNIHEMIEEDAGPLLPISFYGAAKLSSEAFISAWCKNNDAQAWIFRFPNVIGERATHGVIFDFINKLNDNPKELHILGNGKQEKPYLYVKDLVEGILFIWNHSKNDINYYNIGVETTTSVEKIANIIIEEMGLKNVILKYAGGEKGWQGDVPKYQYNLSKIHAMGWKAKMNSDEAVRYAVENILNKSK
jgi:UDP-glucose 4-epimerase